MHGIASSIYKLSEGCCVFPAQGSMGQDPGFGDSPHHVMRVHKYMASSRMLGSHTGTRKLVGSGSLSSRSFMSNLNVDLCL